MSESIKPIPIQKYFIGKEHQKEEINAVNARDLHKALEIGRDFSNWIKDRLEYTQAEENRDYAILKSSKKMISQKNEASNLGGLNARQKRGASNLGGLNKIDYIITLDLAKEFSMLERNNNGKQARKYFIECEKKLHNNTFSFEGFVNFIGDKNLLISASNKLLQKHNTEEIRMKKGFIEGLSLKTLQKEKDQINYARELEKKLIQQSKSKQEEKQIKSYIKSLKSEIQALKAKLETYQEFISEGKLEEKVMNLVSNQSGEGK